MAHPFKEQTRKGGAPSAVKLRVKIRPAWEGGTYKRVRKGLHRHSCLCAVTVSVSLRLSALDLSCRSALAFRVPQHLPLFGREMTVPPMLDFPLACNARIAFNTSRRGAAVAGSTAGERNAAALAMITPFALGGRLGSGDGAPESVGVDVGGGSFWSLGLGAALGGGAFMFRLSRYG
jgi:hypothetical protein